MSGSGVTYGPSHVWAKSRFQLVVITHANTNEESRDVRIFKPGNTVPMLSFRQLKMKRMSLVHYVLSIKCDLASFGVAARCVQAYQFPTGSMKQSCD